MILHWALYSNGVTDLVPEREGPVRVGLVESKPSLEEKEAELSVETQSLEVRVTSPPYHRL